MCKIDGHMILHVVSNYMISMQLLDAMELSRQTMKTVKQNLWWAFGYNIVSCSAFSCLNFLTEIHCEYLMS